MKKLLAIILVISMIAPLTLIASAETANTALPDTILGMSYDTTMLCDFSEGSYDKIEAKDNNPTNNPMSVAGGRLALSCKDTNNQATVTLDADNPVSTTGYSGIMVYVDASEAKNDKGQYGFRIKLNGVSGTSWTRDTGNDGKTADGKYMMEADPTFEIAGYYQVNGVWKKAKAEYTAPATIDGNTASGERITYVPNYKGWIYVPFSSYVTQKAIDSKYGVIGLPADKTFQYIMPLIGSYGKDETKNVYIDSIMLVKLDTALPESVLGMHYESKLLCNFSEGTYKSVSPKDNDGTTNPMSVENGRLALSCKDYNNQATVTLDADNPVSTTGYTGIMVYVDASEAKNDKGQYGFRIKLNGVTGVSWTRDTDKNKDGEYMREADPYFEIAGYYQENGVWKKAVADYSNTKLGDSPNNTTANGERITYAPNYKGWIYVPFSSYVTRQAVDKTYAVAGLPSGKTFESIMPLVGSYDKDETKNVYIDNIMLVRLDATLPESVLGMNYETKMLCDFSDGSFDKVAAKDANSPMSVAGGRLVLSCKDTNNQATVTLDADNPVSTTGYSGIMVYVDASEVKNDKGQYGFRIQLNGGLGLTWTRDTDKNKDGKFIMEADPTFEIAGYYQENGMWKKAAADYTTGGIGKSPNNTTANGERIAYAPNYKGWIYVPFSSYITQKAVDSTYAAAGVPTGKTLVSIMPLIGSYDKDSTKNVYIDDIVLVKLTTPVTEEKEADDETMVSISTKEDVDFNVYADIAGIIDTKEMLPDSDVIVKIGDRESRLTDATEVSATGKITIPVSPAQLNDKITVSLVDTDTTVTLLENYTVYDYCGYMIRNNNDEDTVELCKALINYGKEAQKVFDEGYVGKVIKNGYTSKFTPSVRTATVFATDSETYDPEMISFLALDKSGVRFYYNPTLGESVSIDVGETGFETRDGVVNGYTLDGKMVADALKYVQVEKLNPDDLGKEFTVIVNGLPFAYSALQCVYDLATIDSDYMAFYNALDQYYQAAVACFN